MTTDDVIHWAREAGSMDFGSDSATHVLTVDVLQRMCELVAAAEREACAQVCESMPWVDEQPLPSNHEMAAAIRARWQGVA